MRNGQLVTVGVALMVMGTIAGCGTGNAITSSTDTMVTKKTDTSTGRIAQEAVRGR